MHSGALRLGLVYLVSILFALVYVQMGSEPQTNVEATAEWVAEAPQRAWDQFNLMWSTATQEQRDWVCHQYNYTDGDQMWNQMIADNVMTYDGFNVLNRDLWNQYLAAQCPLLVRDAG